MCLSRKRGGISRLYHNPRWNEDGQGQEGGHPGLANPTIAERCPIVSRVCQFVQVIHIQILQSLSPIERIDKRR
jgi:hypothetical protein